MIRFPKVSSQSMCFMILSLSFCLMSSGTVNAESPIIINEILFNPSGLDHGKEWIELANPSNETRCIAGWTVSNKTGAVIAKLPSWDLPGNSYLVVHFGNGTNDDNFTDGPGHFYTNSAEEIFNNSKDECGLFNSTPSNSSIIDFISWSSDKEPSEGEAFSHALDAGIWKAGNYLNINWTETCVSDGESIGRDKNSTDTNKAGDWNNHGGVDAYFATPGFSNRGPLFSVDNGIFLAQTETNLILTRQAFNITNSSHKIIQEWENENDTFVNASHYFVTTSDNDTILFYGEGIFHWRRINLSASRVDAKLSLSSDYGERIAIDYSLEESKSNNFITHTCEIVNSNYSIQNMSFNYHAESRTDAERLSNNIFLTTINQSINDNSKIRNRRITERVIVHSDVYKETWIDSSDLSKLGNNTSASVHFNTYYDPNGSGAYESIFDKYDIQGESCKNLTLVDKGFYKIENINQYLLKTSWDFTLRNNSQVYFNLSGYGYTEDFASDKEQIVKGNVTLVINELPVKATQFYLDGVLSIIEAGFHHFADHVAKSIAFDIAMEGVAPGSSYVVVSSPITLPLNVFFLWASYEGYKLYYFERDYIYISLGNIREGDKPGMTCYTIAAVTRDGSSLKVDPSDEKICEKNEYCHDITKGRSFYAEDYRGNSKKRHFKIELKADPCGDKDPCIPAKCAAEGKCIREPKCPYKKSCGQDPETKQCCCSEYSCDQGECKWTEEDCSRPCESNDPDVQASCRGDICERKRALPGSNNPDTIEKCKEGICYDQKSAQADETELCPMPCEMPCDYEGYYPMIPVVDCLNNQLMAKMECDRKRAERIAGIRRADQGGEPYIVS